MSDIMFEGEDVIVEGNNLELAVHTLKGSDRRGCQNKLRVQADVLTVAASELQLGGNPAGVTIDGPVSIPQTLTASAVNLGGRDLRGDLQKQEEALHDVQTTTTVLRREAMALNERIASIQQRLTTLETMLGLWRGPLGVSEQIQQLQERIVALERGPHV